METNIHLNAAKGISLKTNEEILNMVDSVQNFDAIVQEAWKRKNVKIMSKLAQNSQFISNPKCCAVLSRFISEIANKDEQLEIMDSILIHPKTTLEKSRNLIWVPPNITQIAALLIISENTPDSLATLLCSATGLSFSRESIFVDENLIDNKSVSQNEVICEIIKLLQKGYSFDNPISFSSIVPRLEFNSNDAFITTLAKHDMSPQIAEKYNELLKKCGGLNPTLKNNFENNQNDGVKTWKITGNLQHFEENLDENIPKILKLIEEQPATTEYIFSVIKNKIQESNELFMMMLEYYSDNKNIFIEFSDINKLMCERVLNLLYSLLKNKLEQGSSFYLQHMNFFDKIFENGIKFGLYNMLSKFPKSTTQYIHSLQQKEQKQPINEIVKPKIEETKATQENEEDIENYLPIRKFFDSNILINKTGGDMSTNWYSIHKEAKFKDVMLASLIAAVGFILFEGANKQDAANKYKVPVEQVDDALKDKDIVEQAVEQREETQEEVGRFTQDQFLSDLRRHEGLRLEPYRDSRGFPTIGYGHRILPGENFRTITRQQAENMLQEDSSMAWEFANNILSSTNAPPVVAGIIANMTFQMGENGVRGFRNMLTAIENEDYSRAAEEMLDSRWARQTPNRARELADRMRNVVTR